jgi:hypothetical protein
MKQITKNIVDFNTYGKTHLFKAYYENGNIAIVAGEAGQIGKLSVNLGRCNNVPEQLEKNEFFVKLYGTADIINKSCLDTGLFEVSSEPFKFNNGMFQKWRLKIV